MLCTAIRLISKDWSADDVEAIEQDEVNEHELAEEDELIGTLEPVALVE